MASSHVRPARLRFRADGQNRLTHYLFRYPAKFHPPIAAALIRNYSRRGDVILDPFCGSGTLLVEARVLGRTAIGLDVDPVATFIADAKTRYIGSKSLSRSVERLMRHIKRIRRTEQDYVCLQFHDIPDRTFSRLVKQYHLDIPPIPNIFHWFRRYVIVDLARLRSVIRRLRVPNNHRNFFMACFCSIIRNVSNADPVPVSGLEVTSHMKAKDAAGRVIDPFVNFTNTLKRALSDREQFEKTIRASGATIQVKRGDAAKLSKHLRRKVNVVITSPPYHNAVDYYRRHTLEMYWLDLVRDHGERLSLLPQYIGRAGVSKFHPFLIEKDPVSSFAARYERMMRKRDSRSANAFKHYTASMRKCFAALATRLPANGKVVFVLGKSSWNGRRLATTKLFEELAKPHFRLFEHHWYPLKNRYMTYSRRNGANIDKEHVLVFERVAVVLPRKVRQEPL